MTTSDDVQLLSTWACPYAIRAKLALTAKGVPFTDLPQDLSNKSSLLLTSNPVHKQIPVLIHNGRAVCESLVIVEYIDEAFPSPHGRALLPKDPYDRAVARFWADFVDKKVFGALVSATRNPGDARKAALEEAKSYLNVLEEALGTAENWYPYFGGANVGFVDLILGPAVVWVPAVEEVSGVELLDKAPRLAAWMKTFQQSPVAASLPSLEKLVERVRVRFAK